MQTVTELHFDTAEPVRLNETTVHSDGDWIIVNIGGHGFGSVKLSGSPEVLLALAEGIKDAAHTAELARMTKASEAVAR